MIKSKKQGFVFGLIMSYAMAIGMECTTRHITRASTWAEAGSAA